MNGWRIEREVEKPKTLTGKRLDAKNRATAQTVGLIEVERYIVGVWGDNSPLLSEVRAARGIISELIDLLPVKSA